MKKLSFLFGLIIVFSIFFIGCISIAKAQLDFDNEAGLEVFKAEVIDILGQEVVTDDSGVEYVQQDLKLKGLEGQYRGRDIFFYGISDLRVLSQIEYSEGDKVLVAAEYNSLGEKVFYVTDYVRTGSIYWLLAAFVATVLLVGKFKGLRSLIGLGLSFVIILKFIIPQILIGRDPLLVSISGCFLILIVSVYLTQGWNQKAHIINISLLLSLLIVSGLSLLFTSVTKLAGFASEEILFLVDLNQGQLNLRGLLLAGILIGTLGVLDDVIINQVSVVEQIKKANARQNYLQVARQGLKVGVDHISSMTNTLFFAYAGASLPLLILFNINQPPFLEFSQIINHQLIATEIARTLVGSIGLMLAIPISNLLASKYLKIG